jgi:putative thioredoxin
MSESPYIHNVSMQNFQNLVLEKSINKPVLVDFWADWCQPCQTIMPMLAKMPTMNRNWPRISALRAYPL